MRVVIVTAKGCEHAFVTKQLVESLGGHLSGIVIEQGISSKSIISSVRKVIKRYSIFFIIERIITKIVRKILRSDNRQYAAFKAELDCLAFGEIIPKNVNVLVPETVNSVASVEWIKEINPDYIFVFGTGIVGKKVLALPIVQTLNLHTGLSPHYRGSSCNFWPLYNFEPLMVGSTVHKCTAEVDGGDIYSRISVRLSIGDTPYIAMAKSVRSGAKLYAHIAKSLVEGEDVPFEKQDFSIGTEYRFKDKTFLHELKMEFLINSGVINRLIKKTQNEPLPYSEYDKGDQFSVE